MGMQNNHSPTTGIKHYSSTDGHTNTGGPEYNSSIDGHTVFKGLIETMHTSNWRPCWTGDAQAGVDHVKYMRDTA